MSDDSGVESRPYAEWDRNTSADELRRLATDPDEWVREAATGNPRNSAG